MTILSRAESRFLCHHSSAFFPIFLSLAMALLSPAAKMMWWDLRSQNQHQIPNLLLSVEQMRTALSMNISHVTL